MLTDWPVCKQEKMVDYILFPIRFFNNSVRSLWRYVSIWKRLNIVKGDIVLEVGSGHRPGPRSDILVDKFLADDFERDGYKMVIDRAVVIGDAEKLPFKDLSVNYVYSSQLIEHLENPEAFIKEMMRVSHRGVIICPSRLFEIFTAFPYHQWFVDVREGKIILEKKTQPSTHEVVRQFISKYQSNYIIFQNLWHFWNWSWYDFNHIFEWKNDISYEIIDHDNVDDSLFTFASIEKGRQRSNRPSFLLRWIYNIVIKVTRWCIGGTKIDLFSLIACPVCHQDLLMEDATSLVCRKCKLKYPILKMKNKEVPLLLLEKAQKWIPNDEMNV